ncbi:hypothetical protein [Kribbella monticola]|uniref:hypothetical protein n=1 Tax=Kribbella monticola TaxID=2185285 RepID=UPI0018E5781B|nr:hypothetical protein [Kribbella monticola]
MKRVLRTAAATSVLLVAGLAIAPTQADAANGTVGVRETVCAQDLQLRTDPGGARSGTLHYGQTFLVERVIPGWAYGFAYGDINHRGWVQDGWFC